MGKFEYPILNIKTIEGFYKRISANRPKTIIKNKKLFEECLVDFSKLWNDNLKCSDPDKEKWVRNCSFSNLKRVVSQIDQVILKKLDSALPDFIHGAISHKDEYDGVLISRSPQTAAKSLIDGKKNRWMLKMDLQSFFETIPQDRIIKLLQHRFKCSPEVSFFISEFCCIEKGKKGSSKDVEKVLARGFAPSGRLAIWSSLDFFLALSNLVKKELKGCFPKLAIFVDDIGITAINVSNEDLEKLATKIIKLAKSYSLKINEGKKEIINPSETKEFVGNLIRNNKIFISKKSYSKQQRIADKIKHSADDELEGLKKTQKGLVNYRNQTKKISLL